ncbi:L-amino acid N-acyltransferase YncA [Parafrankia irregularis]|uniref:L-amino acid N-acyltransferase YncA n=1 Tax=Parafrankia irregularis TaxID=795642 RepID=A0A0S4QKA6_9ACTN|nr:MULTISPECIES: N-acetyltransferase [Parafrankia]MBE3203900.1 N-acetyltransferase [Parafrankia sp. CH37]CUU55228.1 L-amino acid N-acyltransferase YncA [Parafrankia irregularis]
MRTRRATEDDWPAIWPVWHSVVAEGETCPWDPGTDEASARRLWMLPEPAQVLVMEVDDGPASTRVVATALLVPAQPDLGSHVVLAQLLIDPTLVNLGGGAFGPGGYGPAAARAAAARAVGRAAGEGMIDYAVDLGYRAMQVNAVVAANTQLVALWRSLSFRMVGTLPAAFDHPWQGEVDLYVMHRFLPLPRQTP